MGCGFGRNKGNVKELAEKDNAIKNS
jgi:hypothetical protein